MSKCSRGVMNGHMVAFDVSSEGFAFSFPSHRFGFTEERVELIVQEQLGEESSTLEIGHPVEQDPRGVIDRLAHRALVEHYRGGVFIGGFFDQLSSLEYVC